MIHTFNATGFEMRFWKSLGLSLIFHCAENHLVQINLTSGLAYRVCEELLDVFRTGWLSHDD